MTTNRLAVIPKDRPGKVTMESLEAYAARLDGELWVRASGKPYFVNKREENDQIIHFLDRNA